MINKKKTIKIIFYSLSAILGIMILSAFGETYFVSPNGTASWGKATNMSTPTSLDTAMQSARAGDTVNFFGGIYILPDGDHRCNGTGLIPVIFPENSGTESQPIIFQAYTPQGGDQDYVFFDNSANQLGACGLAAYGTVSTDWIVWNGIDTKAVNNGGASTRAGKAVVINNSNHVTVSNARIEGVKGNSNNNGIRVEKSDYTEISNCIIWNVLPLDSEPDVVNPSGVEYYTSRNCRLHHTTIYNCTNAVYDKGGDRDNLEIDHNFFYSTNGSMVRGIQANVKGQHETGKKFHHNIIIGGTAITINHIGEAGGTANGFKIYNNTIYNSSRGITESVKSDVLSDCNNILIYNNIIVSTQIPYKLKSICNSNSNVDYNAYFHISYFMFDSNTATSLDSFKSYTPNGWDNHSIVADPHFVKAGGLNPEDYILKSDSPLKAKGNNGKDIGAFPNGNDGTIIGYDSDYDPGGHTVGDAVSPPKNLRVIN